jgi:hypothetical protein
MTTFYINSAGDFYHGDMMEGDREATPEELDARNAALAKADVLSTIDRLERAAQAPRFVREALLDIAKERAIALGAANGLTAEQSLALLQARNLGYAKLKALDDQIAVLRVAAQ